jgi:DNA invertase Pin-like site-specific DNA recombinase
MKIGYARTSTHEQKASLLSQQETLKQEGCEKLFIEEASAVSNRPILEAAIEFAREGDILVVKSMDRLARSVAHMVELSKTLEEKKVILHILNMNVDTSTPTGKLILNVVSSISQFERELMLERQKIGIVKAKAEGKFRGRKPTVMARKEEILKLVNQGMSKRQIARDLGIGEASIYRIIKLAKDAA